MAKIKRSHSKPSAVPEVPTTLPDDLPAPSTSRNLLPRSRATSLARSASRSLPGSRNSSRHSSAPGSAMANLPASVLSESRPPTPAGGGTMTFQSGSPTDPNEQGRLSRPSERTFQQQDSTFQPPVAFSGSMQPFGNLGGLGWGEGMYFRQDEPDNRWPLGYHGSGTPQFNGPHLIDEESEDELGAWTNIPGGPVLRNNDDTQRPGPSGYQNEASSSYMAPMIHSNMYQHSGMMGGQQADTESSYYNESQAGYAVGSSSSSSSDPYRSQFTSIQPSYHDPRPMGFSSFNDWTTAFDPPQDMGSSLRNDIRMETSTGTDDRKRKRSFSSEHRQESSSVPSFIPPHSLQQQTTDILDDENDQFELADDGEVAQQLLYSDGPSGSLQPQTQPENVDPEPPRNHDRKGKGKARADVPMDADLTAFPSVNLAPSSPALQSGTEDTRAIVNNINPTIAKPPGDPFSTYTCPICFSPPTNATITPCGHICCGECLFAAVKTTLQRAGLGGIGIRGGLSEARCPVCRANIPGWDGKGGGVIGLKVRAVFSL